MIYKARYKANSDTEFQTLSTHLNETGMYVELFAKEISLPKPGLLTALVHDLSKNCRAWQEYLDESHKTSRKDQKEDHATVNGQCLYKNIVKNPKEGNKIIVQLLEVCLINHYAG